MVPRSTYFDLELRPGRSLQPRQFAWMILAVSALFAIMGLRFLWLGAWPILPFLLIDVALLAWAMRASYRSARQSETLRLDGVSLQWLQISTLGGTSIRRMEPRQAQARLEAVRPGGNRLWIEAGATRLEIGRFLSPQERAELAVRIEAGLRHWRDDNR